MHRAVAINTLAVTWAASFAASFVHAAMTAPTGDGFTRGLNRVGIWLGWQVVALVVAIVVAGFAFGLRAALPRRLRWTAYAPLVVSGALLGALVLFYSALIAYSMWERPAPGG